jgi:hypothetical protein
LEKLKVNSGICFKKREENRRFFKLAKNLSTYFQRNSITLCLAFILHKNLEQEFFKYRLQGRSQHIATYRIAIGFALRYIAKRLRYIAKLRG